MRLTPYGSPRRTTPPLPSGGATGSLWAVVLAGGEGSRLRQLTALMYGVDRPKQFAALMGPRTLLRDTLERVALRVPPERTVVVTRREHAGYAAVEFGHDACPPAVIAQPEDRGTAAGVLLPLHWIHWRDPEATVAVFPSDHFVLEESAFMAHVSEVATVAGRRPGSIILLGAQPTDPDAGYGWIEPGARVDRTQAGPIFEVRRFWEKPSAAAAQSCLERGCLWNTFVMVGTVRAFIEAGRRSLPALHDRLARIGAFADTEHEAWAIEQAYALAPTANFSEAVLESCPPGLEVSLMPALTWSDLGTPARVLETLTQLGAVPPWRAALEPTAGWPAGPAFPRVVAGDHAAPFRGEPAGRL